MVHYGKCKGDVLTIFIETTMHLVLPPPPPPEKGVAKPLFQIFFANFGGGGGGGGIWKATSSLRENYEYLSFK